MKRAIAVLGVAGLVIGAFVIPQASAGPLEDQFFQMDKSRDGAISRSEFMSYQTSNGMSERRANFAFDNLKGDDNAVSLTEYRAGPNASRTAPQRLQRRQDAQTRRRSRNERPQRRRAQRSVPSRSGGFGGGGGGGS